MEKKLWDCHKTTCKKSKYYNYKRVKLESVEIIGAYVKGFVSGLIYVAKTEKAAKKAMKSKKATDVIIYDNRSASDPNMKIYDSYKIRDKDIQNQIIDVMINYNNNNITDPSWNRTKDSLQHEWDIHNNVLIAPFYKKNTSDVDFNNADEGKGYWDFFVERVLRKLF